MDGQLGCFQYFVLTNNAFTAIFFMSDCYGHSVVLVLLGDLVKNKVYFLPLECLESNGGKFSEVG